MYLTEQEKKDKLSKYDENISNDLFNHLRRHFTVTEFKYDWMSKPIRFIKVGDKTRPMEQNKKYLVNLISNHVEGDWNFLGKQTIRRTIKKYLDSLL